MDQDTLILTSLVSAAIYFGLFYWVISAATRAGNKEMTSYLRTLVAMKEIELEGKVEELTLHKATVKAKERERMKELIGTAYSKSDFMAKMKELS